MCNEETWMFRLSSGKEKEKLAVMSVHPAETLKLPTSVVTVGAFDGVHRGHQALIRRAGDSAARFGVPLVVYTFDPPPRAFFRTPGYSPRCQKSYVGSKPWVWTT